MPDYKRQAYNVNSLYVGPTPATGDHFSGGNTGTNLVEQLHRVISFSDNFNIPLQGASQVGQLAEFAREPNGTPTPSITFDYYLHNGVNEDRLGFNIDGQTSFLSGVLNNTEDEKNYFIMLVPEGNDAVGYTDRTQMKTIGIGNGYLTNYSLTASVNDFATASVSAEGINYDIRTGSSNVPLPSINPDNGQLVTGKNFTLPFATSGVAGMPKLIKRGDIKVDFSSMANVMGVKLDGTARANIQSFTLDVPLSRTPIDDITSKYATSRQIDFPLNATLSLETLVTDLNTGSLSDFLGCQVTEYDFDITFSSCEGATTTEVFRVIARGATLDQQSFNQATASQGRTATVNLSIPIGAPQQTYPMIAFSGSHTV